MGKSQQELTKHPKTSRKTGRKPSGATGNEPTPPASPASNNEPEPGEGADRLRSAINRLVGQQCGRIAQALVDKTIAGNMTGARLLADLSGAKNPRNQPPKKRFGPSDAERLAMEPPWQGPPEDDEDVGFAGLEPEN